MHIPPDLFPDLIIGVFVVFGAVVIRGILTKDPTGKR